MAGVRFDYHGQQVLITGGTTGIGRAVAQAFADAGARVLVTGVTAAEVDAFRSEHSQITAQQLDVTDNDAVAALAGTLAELHVLVNCAGVIRRQQAEFDPDVFEQVLDVNLTGTMRMCTACRPLLAHSRGSIVNLASMLSYFGSGFAPAYSASKGGIAQLTKSLAIAWAEAGIRVNAIAPGWITTPLTQPLVDNPQRSAEILGRTPLGRWGQPQDVAGAVLFLGSEAASFITGTILPVDGGYLIA